MTEPDSRRIAGDGEMGAGDVGERPKVTIVTPVFNGERYLRENLDASTGQTETALEVVVADDCSTDSTPDILDEYSLRFPGRLRHLRMPRNSGPARATNAAILAARGQWIAYISADDLLDREFAARHLREAAAHPGTRFTFSDFHQIDASGKVIRDVTFGQFRDRADLLLSTVRTDTPSLCSALIHREVLETVGIFDPESFSYDTDLLARAFLKYHPLHVPGCLASYRVHGGQGSRAIYRGVQGRAMVMARMARDFPPAIWVRGWVGWYLRLLRNTPWMLRVGKFQGAGEAMLYPLREVAALVRAAGSPGRDSRPPRLGPAPLPLEEAIQVSLTGRGD
ncbi:MAG TPA: glycosyltransferase [Thermoplasmata archaeon]|nr:glycosyltransferase [Thermoplasmata archaeon]